MSLSYSLKCILKKLNFTISKFNRNFQIYFYLLIWQHWGLNPRNAKLYVHYFLRQRLTKLYWLASNLHSFCLNLPSQQEYRHIPLSLYKFLYLKRCYHLSKIILEFLQNYFFLELPATDFKKK